MSTLSRRMPEIAAKVLAMLDEMESTADSDAFAEAMSYRAAAGPPETCRMALRLAVLSSPVFVGQGGMGQVYAAHDPDLDREVALKLIAAKDDASSEGFIREAQAVSALNHPNIVTVHEVIRSGSMLAIAMELVTGTSLRQFCGAPQPIGRSRSGDGRSPARSPRLTRAASFTGTSSRRT